MLKHIIAKKMHWFKQSVTLSKRGFEVQFQLLQWIRPNFREFLLRVVIWGQWQEIGLCHLQTSRCKLGPWAKSQVFVVSDFWSWRKWKNRSTWWVFLVLVAPFETQLLPPGVPRGPANQLHSPDSWGQQVLEYVGSRAWAVHVKMGAVFQGSKSPKLPTVAESRNPKIQEIWK